jgi:hypothetical protein
MKKKKKVALEAIRESAEFWLPIFNEEALRCVNNDSTYANPWFPVEFARRILELVEVAEGSK